MKRAAQPRPQPLSADHIATVRAAVAASYRRDDLEHVAALTEAGAYDYGPRMVGGLAAVQAVLDELFA